MDFLTFLAARLKSDKPSTVITVDYLLKAFADFAKTQHSSPPHK